MTSTDEPLDSDHWQWLDRWFAVRWLVVLTWVAFAIVSGASLDTFVFQGTIEHVFGMLVTLSASLGIVIPQGFQMLVEFVNLFVLIAWFQPLLLRLHWLRTLIWLAISTVSTAGFFIVELRYLRGLGALFWTAGPGIAGLALIGRRSRPWMSVLAWAISACAVHFLLRFRVAHPDSGPFWLILAASNFPYALVMIYGTKLLGREDGSTRVDGYSVPTTEEV